MIVFTKEKNEIGHIEADVMTTDEFQLFLRSLNNDVRKGIFNILISSESFVHEKITYTFRRDEEREEVLNVWGYRVCSK